MLLVNSLEGADIPWCAIGGVAVNHWAAEPMVTQDVDFVVATDAIERAVAVLSKTGFRPEKFKWSINFTGHSRVSLQLSTEDFYRDFPARAVPADVHGILLRVASLEDTFKGKIKALKEYQKKLQENKVKIYVRRGGPNYQEGLRQMRDLGQQLGVPIEVYGPETHMTKIVSMALKGAN